MTRCVFRRGAILARLLAGALGLAIAQPALPVNGAVSSYAFVNDDGSLRISRALALPDAPFDYQAVEKIPRHRGIGVWGFPIDPRP